MHYIKLSYAILYYDIYIYIYIYLFIYLFIYTYIYLFIYVFICLIRLGPVMLRHSHVTMHQEEVLNLYRHTSSSSHNVQPVILPMVSIVAPFLGYLTGSYIKPNPLSPKP